VSKSSRAAHPTRSAILNVSRRLYAASDYSGVTMRAIAKKVGCRSPSLYHYFKSKDDIFRALVDRGTILYEKFLPTIDSTDPFDRLWWRFWRYYEFSKAHPEYFRLMFVDRSSPVGDPTLHARALSGADTRRCIEECVKAGILPQGTDPIEASVVLWCTIHGVAVMGMRGKREPWPWDRLAERTLSLAFDGLRAGLREQSSRPSPMHWQTHAGPALRRNGPTHATRSSL
jgi:AcrR family transcriptional regulator